MRTAQAAIAIAIVAFLMAGYSLFGSNKAASISGIGSPAFNHVTQTGELRVGYLILPPYLSKDTATGRMSGVFYDFTESLGQKLGLKVVWVEEVNLGNLTAGLDTARYDMIAFPLWESASRAKAVGFSRPLFYTVVGAYVRAQDNRFDASLAGVNSPSTRIATMDGEMAETIAHDDFPNASTVSVPQYSDYSQLLLQVVSGKADITFFDREFGSRFMKQNPSQLKEVSGKRPVRVFANVFLLPLGDEKFRSMIDGGLTELIDNGILDADMTKHGVNADAQYRVALPYRAPGL